MTSNRRLDFFVVSGSRNGSGNFLKEFFTVSDTAIVRIVLITREFVDEFVDR